LLFWLRERSTYVYNITLIPRRQPDIYLYSSESMDEINEFEQIIKDMRDEK
jgi:hypothetical protein